MHQASQETQAFTCVPTTAILYCERVRVCAAERLRVVGGEIDYKKPKGVWSLTHSCSGERC